MPADSEISVKGMAGGESMFAVGWGGVGCGEGLVRIQTPRITSAPMKKNVRSHRRRGDAIRDETARLAVGCVVGLRTGFMWAVIQETRRDKTEPGALCKVAGVSRPCISPAKKHGRDADATGPHFDRSRTNEPIAPLVLQRLVRNATQMGRVLGHFRTYKDKTSGFGDADDLIWDKG